MEDKIAKLREMITESDNIVFFGGAGVSTESASRTSAAWTACITRSGNTRRRPF